MEQQGSWSGATGNAALRWRKPWEQQGLREKIRFQFEHCEMSFRLKWKSLVDTYMILEFRRDIRHNFRQQFMRCQM